MLELKKHKWIDNISKISKKKKIIVVSVVILLLAAGGVFWKWITERNCIEFEKHIVEAGEEIRPEDFLKKGKKADVSFAKGSEDIDTTVLGERKIKIKVGLFSFECKLEINDSIAPTADAVTVYYEPGEKLAPEQFVENVKDVTETIVEFVAEPDFSSSGLTEVQIRITDQGNNETIINSRMVAKAAKEEVIIEAGSEFPDIKQFLKTPESEATFITNINLIDTKKLGTYKIEFKSNGIEYFTNLIIKDTVAPVLNLREVTIYDNENVTIESFVESIQDNTSCNLAFENEFTTTTVGEQTVVIVAKDEAGNETKKETKLTVMHDSEPPILYGIHDIISFLGDSIDYLAGVSASDNHDNQLQINVTGAVDINNEGIYNVEYSVEDVSGNKTTQLAQVQVVRDLEAPVISGIDEIYAIRGEYTNFKYGVSVWDNHDGNVQLNVDSSAVNTEVVGDYPITFTATDSAGNTTSISTVVHVFIQLSKEYPYEIRVNKLANCVTVYTQDENTGEYTVPYKAFICSSGGENTPEGSFKISDKYVWHALIHNVYGQYVSRIYKGILFHSVPYTATRNDALQIDEFNKLGESASAGCIRMMVQDTKWIYDNCPSGTRVIIYSDDYPGPLGKPGAPQITSGIAWDPTDPNPDNPAKIDW